jgi:Bifunctional DNA primase/polymerase, N-terminal
MSTHGNPAGTGRAPGTCSSSNNDPANTTAIPPLQGNIAAVLYLASLGFAVFPCWPWSKHPATPRGFYNATTNPATLRRWWLANPDFNIAIRTGIASGVWVLDIDGDAGATAVAKLEAEHGPLPDTLISATSNGCHLWFCYTCPITSSQGRIARGLDVCGDRRYAMAPPSVHPDGPIYRWLNDRRPAVAPEWLVGITRNPQPSISERALGAMAVPSPPGCSDAYGKAALDQEISILTNTPKGARNRALNRASFSLHQLVAGGELDSAEVQQRLIEAATANGLMSDPDDGPRRVALTIASGARAGLQHPRNRRGAS